MSMTRASAHLRPREWGLYTGSEFETVQRASATSGWTATRIGSWTIPEGSAAKGAYFGSFFSKEHVARLRQTLDQSPAAATCKTATL